MKITQILNCFYHGCPTCYPGRTKLVGGEAAEELLLRTNKRMDRLRTVCPDVEPVWECKIQAMLKDNEEMRKFFDGIEIVGRLKPRDALYGGRVKVFRAFLKRVTNEKKICYFDIVSMYPSVQALREYPLGQPEVKTAGFEPITGTKLPYRGLIKLRILPPRNLSTAVLHVHVDSGLLPSLFHLC
ncbi:hypothetical protein PMAYCL1PPCAC_25857 [Pristionchus mayeri]|uniref:DNA-directed DNA polymerase n=1 Tax=Pristionchus mayeri TaxID=1317129 RepID=A0AAN5I7P7_9BILA|nr:hypothetical protein PMAYCL1PPCAC_25857 [Pristionchus mayeri]